MSNKNKGISKKAQIGQTMTWVVATLVILLILFLFISAAGSDKIYSKVLGAGHFIEDKGSAFASQQTLFAVLSKETESQTIKDIISSQDYEKTRIEIQKILDKFEEDGVKCRFEISVPKKFQDIEPTSARSILLSVDNINMAVLPKISSSVIQINQEYASLECLQP